MGKKPNIIDTASSDDSMASCTSCASLPKDIERLKEKARNVLWYIKYDSLRDGINRAVKELEMEIALDDLRRTPSSGVKQD